MRSLNILVRRFLSLYTAPRKKTCSQQCEAAKKYKLGTTTHEALVRALKYNNLCAALISESIFIYFVSKVTVLIWKIQFYIFVVTRKISNRRIIDIIQRIGSISIA